MVPTPEQLVGRRIGIWWATEDCYYHGTGEERWEEERGGIHPGVEEEWWHWGRRRGKHA